MVSFEFWADRGRTGKAYGFNCRRCAGSFVFAASRWHWVLTVICIWVGERAEGVEEEEKEEEI